MDITPKDATETKALGIGQRISLAIGILISTVVSLCAAAGGVDWLTANLPMLGTGVGALVTGGLTAYVAVRRMRIDKLASSAKLLALLMLPAALLMSGGCAGVYTPKISAISFGLDSAQLLNGLNVTRCQTGETNDYYEIILDSSSGQQSSGQLIDGLIAIGEIAARARSGGAVSAQPVAAAVEASDASDVAVPSVSQESDTAYSADGYGAVPGETGEGVYGRPACGRCRAYRASHPGVELINFDDAKHRADMWAALRLRGYTGTTAALPVSIDATSYVMPAK